MSSIRSGWCLSSLFVVFSGLSGCIDHRGIQAMAQRLQDPDLQPDAAIMHAVDETHWPETDWWTAYGDPQLNQWIELSLASSPTLAEAEARVREARAVAGIAEAEEAPQGDFDMSIQRKRWPNDMFYGPSTLARTTSWNNLSSLGMSYDMDLWGRLRSDRERTLSLALVAATEERAAALELANNVVQAYIEFALGFEQLEIAEAELEQREEMLDLVRQRYEIGLATRFELSEAEAPIPEAKRRVDQQEESIALSRNALAALAGQGPGAGARLHAPELSLHGESSLPSELPLELVGRRPDVVARRWGVAAEARSIEMATADFYPNVNLMASIGTMAVQGSMLDFLKYDKLTYSVGPALSLPVFDGGRRRSTLRRENARYDQAVDRYNQTLIMALKHISDQLIRLHSLHEQSEFSADAIATGEQRYALAQEAYQRGLTDYRDVLAAQTWLFEQQRIQQDIHAAQMSAQAELWVQLGGGMLGAKAGPDEQKLESEAPSLHASWLH